MIRRKFMKTRLIAALMIGLVLACMPVTSPVLASPSNDYYYNATPINWLPFHDAKDLAADPPTRSGVGEPILSCAGRPRYTVWYKLAGNNSWIDTNTFG